jgi:hypothetical protein
MSLTTKCMQFWNVFDFYQQIYLLLCFFLLWCWTPLSTIFQLYSGNKMSVPITTDVVISNLDQGCTTLCDKICQWLPTGRLFSPGPPVSSTNKTDRHCITEILLGHISYLRFLLVFVWSGVKYIFCFGKAFFVVCRLCC